MVSETDVCRAFDHHDEEMYQNPWPVYASLRKQCPVAHSEKYGGFWVLTRYEDVYEAAHDPATFSSEGGLTIPHMGADAARPMIPIEMDPPLHGAFRRLTQRVFSPGYLASWDPFITKTVRELIDAFAARGEADFVDEFAVPIPMTVITEMLGISHEDHVRFKDWSTKLVQQHHLDPETQQQTAEALYGYFAQEIAERRQRPDLGTDLVSILVGAEIEGRPLTDEEILDYCFLLLLAGNETTTNAMGSSLCYLAEHPELRQRLADQPDLIPTAVEEFLRYFSTVQGLARTATRDVTIGDQTIRQGDKVYLCWASADHDPDQFVDPEEFIVSREPNLHFAFGAGPHRCLGSNLARQEMRIALSELLARIPDFRFADGFTPRWFAGPTRGVYHLRVAFQPTP